MQSATHTMVKKTTPQFPLLSPNIESAGEDVMGFLNEVQLNYPDAVSLASGRPDERFFDMDSVAHYFNAYVNREAGKGSRQRVLGLLGQYSRARGIVNDHLASWLAKDEDIHATPESIVVTVGTQEAILLALLTLCNREKDVVVVENPAYIGITACAAIAGCTTDPVAVTEQGLNLEQLERRIRYHRRHGRYIKIVYVIPDFQNPTGACMPEAKRRQLLQMAATYNFFILEDNAYSEFRFTGARVPPIKAFDTDGRVIYLRSFSKTLYPSLRLAAMVADSIVPFKGRPMLLSHVLAATKGYTTVNTPAVTQAVLGGILAEHRYSLKKFNKPKVAAIGRKRRLMLAALDKYMGLRRNPWARGISWNRPEGGFFLVITLPVKVAGADVEQCARAFRVIFTPMSFFSAGPGGERQIRLAYSNIPDDEIPATIQRLAAFIQTKILSQSKKSKS